MSLSDLFITISFGGENSHFLRFSQSKIRQNGRVHDASLNISLNIKIPNRLEEGYGPNFRITSKRYNF